MRSICKTVIFLITSGVLTIASAGVAKVTEVPEMADVADVAGIAGKAVDLSIMKDPAKLIAAIYQMFHDWKVDEGLTLIDKSLSEIDPILRKNPETELPDKNLKIKRVYQVSSALHTLKGMLAQRKALKLLNDAEAERVKKGSGALPGVATEQQKLDTADFPQYINIQKEAATFSTLSVTEFRAAINIDPANPTPHFELGKVYSQILSGGDTANAEEEFFKAALCSFSEGDFTAASSTIEMIRTLNPKSSFISDFEKKYSSTGSGK